MSSAPVSNPHSRTRLWQGLLIAAGCLLVNSTLFAQQPFNLIWSSDRLTVRASNAPAQDVMRTVAEKTGIEVVGLEKVTGQISVDFADLPLLEALPAILTGHNYTVTERPVEGGTVKKIVLTVHSAHYAFTASGPIAVPALDAFDAGDLDQDDSEPPSEEEEIDRENELQSLMELEASGAFGPDADFSALRELFESDEVEIRRRALTAIAQRPLATVLRTMVSAMADEDAQVRRIAVDFLARQKDKDSLQRMGTVLAKETDTTPRVAALRVIAFRADPASQAFLRPLVKDPDAVIRDAVAQILAEFERRSRPAGDAAR